MNYKIEKGVVEIISSEAGLVFKLEDYVYSGAIDRAGEKGLLDGVCVC